jgi:hypothetical protein
VGLRLPRRPAQPAWRRALVTGWRLAPVGLIGAWAFVEAVFFVARAVLGALQLGLGGDALASLLPATQQSSWGTQLLGLSGANLGEVGRVLLQMLSNGGPLGWSITLHAASLAVIGLLYCSWLASWWARRQHQSQQA